MINDQSRRRFFALLVANAIVAVAVPTAHAQLRIGTYNIEADTNGNTAPNAGLTTVLQGIGNEVVNGFARPLDILTLQETTSNVLTVDPIVNALNAIPQTTAHYARSSYQADQSGGTGTGNGPNSILWNTNTVQLISAVGVGTVGTSGPPRRIARYQFRPVGYTDSSSDFYIYVSHMKASSGTANSDRRNNEAQQIRANASNAQSVPPGARILYTGDYNLNGGTSEPAWATIGAAGNGQAIDPAGGSFARQYWSEATTDLFARYDFQLNTVPTTDAHGFSIINGSYHTFGNNGTTPGGAAVTSASNTALANLPNRSAVISAMTTAADHYPVIADYRLPAKVGLSVSAPARVIVGGIAPINATVTNAAPVQIAIGADTLDYGLTSSGALSGSGNGTGVAAMSAGNVHALSIDTSTPGERAGTVSVTTTSQDTTAGPVIADVSVSVLEHAHASLSTQRVDFGPVAANGGTRVANLFIANSLGANATAGLDLDSILFAGNTNVFGTNAPTFSKLPAGNGTSSKVPFSVAFVGGQPGRFSATYTFNFSDENLSGAINLPSLSLTLTGSVAPAGDTDFSGLVSEGDYGVVDAHDGLSNASWSDGDFNADGIVNFADFAMMDEAFVLQTDGGGYNGTMARAIRYLNSEDRDASMMSTPELKRVMQDESRFGDEFSARFLTVVPEPTIASAFVFLCASALRRSRKSSNARPRFW